MTPIAHFTRRYHFSASHRLHCADFTDEQNRAVFGKCNNPYGHGHNYIVEVTVAGLVDPVTGFVCDMVALDAHARREIVDRYDLQNLNTLAAFQTLVPSTENLAVTIFDAMAGFGAARLARIHVAETDNNSFEYFGPAHSATENHAS